MHPTNWGLWNFQRKSKFNKEMPLVYSRRNDTIVKPEAESITFSTFTNAPSIKNIHIKCFCNRKNMAVFKSRVNYQNSIENKSVLLARKTTYEVQPELSDKYPNIYSSTKSEHNVEQMARYMRYNLMKSCLTSIQIYMLYQ